MLAHHFSQYSSRRCSRMVPEAAQLINPSAYTQHQTFRPVLAVKLLRIMFRNRCWPTTFHTIITGDADAWCHKRLTWSAPHVPITPNFPSHSGYEIVEDYDEKWMLAHHFSHYYSRRCSQMVLEAADMIRPSAYTQKQQNLLPLWWRWNAVMCMMVFGHGGGGPVEFDCACGGADLNDTDAVSQTRKDSNISISNRATFHGRRWRAFCFDASKVSFTSGAPHPWPWKLLGCF